MFRAKGGDGGERQLKKASHVSFRKLCWEIFPSWLMPPTPFRGKRLSRWWNFLFNLFCSFFSATKDDEKWNSRFSSTCLSSIPRLTLTPHFKLIPPYCNPLLHCDDSHVKKLFISSNRNKTEWWREIETRYTSVKIKQNTSKRKKKSSK